jgi:hypothetical protein
MATMPFQNEPTDVQLKIQSAGRATNTATPEMLAGEESWLGKLAGVATPIIEAYAIKKQNELDTRDTQSAYTAWKEMEMEFEMGESKKKLQQADGGLLRSRQFYDGMGLTPSRPLGTLTPEEADRWGRDQTQTKTYARFKERYDKLPDRLKPAIDLLIEKRKPDFLLKAMQHETKEREASVVQETDTSIKQSTTMAINNYKFDDSHGEEKQDIKNAVEAQAKLYNWDAATTKQKLHDKISVVHSGIISMWLSSGGSKVGPVGKDGKTKLTGVETAQKYLETYKNELTPKAHDAIVKTIRDTYITTQGAFHSRVALTMDEGAAGDYLLGLQDDDPEVYSKALTLYRNGSAFAGKKAVALRNAAKNAFADYLRGEGYYKNKGPGSMDNIPPALMQDKKYLTSEDRNQMDVLEAHIAGSGPPVTHSTDSKTQDEVNQLLRTPGGVAKFKGMSIGLEYDAKAFPATVKSLRTMQEKLLAGDDSPIKWNNRLTNHFLSQKWIGEDYARHRGDTGTLFAQAMDEWMADPKHGGKAPSGKEVEEIINGVMTVKHLTEMALHDPLPDAPDAIKPDFTVLDIINNAIKGMALDTTKPPGERTESDIKAWAAGKIDAINASRSGRINPKTGSAYLPVSTKEAQMIIDTIITDKVYTDDTWLPDMFDSPDKRDLRTMAEIERNPGKYPRKDVFVLAEDNKGDDRRISLSDIDALPETVKVQIGRFLNQRGLKPTIQNQAEAWLVSSDATIGKIPDISRSGLIKNPNGILEMNLKDLRRMVIKRTPSRLLAHRVEVAKMYGPIAQEAYDRMALRRIVSRTEFVEETDEFAEIQGQVAKIYGSRHLEYFQTLMIEKDKREKKRISGRGAYYPYKG